ncbi:trypsin-like cysteine/serine peptidase domain-containing protein [Tanacetum coccineum]|uniref:Trypsin-like cysteine/serine peptidase domain-containing protein n=1 Tax=Tanacetum coccineum TaxID=301880 RepID=A0ABQ5HDK4_9ASTR
MGVLCFCNGICKSEKTKCSILSVKGLSMARVSNGSGFLIHRNLLLTSHAVLPSLAAAQAAEIHLQNGAAALLVPNRFFITSSVLDLTIVGLDVMDGDSNITVQQSHYLKTGSKPNLDLGSAVYLLGYTDKNELTVGEGKVVIATDNLIKVSPDGVTWSHGSAGFDVHGNLSFMICDPMKLATSPTMRSSSTSSSSTSSWKKNPSMQFGIPIPVIYDWLNQHWEGSLDDLVNKPKLPIIRLMSTGQKSEHSCSSFTKRRVFKTSENENEISKPKDQPGSSSPPMVNSFQDETPPVNRRPGIPTPEIYESPKVTSGAFRRPENTQVQLLDINFPPRITKRTVPPKLHTNPIADAEIASPGSVNGAHSEVQSCASPIPQAQNEYISDGETTMYSAETAESRNYPSPKEGRLYQQQVGRSQSCVSYNRWGSGSVQRNPIAGRVTKGYSQGASSHRSNDFYSPTVSSIMKKQNNFEKQPNRPRSSATRSSPKWTF